MNVTAPQSKTPHFSGVQTGEARKKDEITLSYEGELYHTTGKDTVDLQKYLPRKDIMATQNGKALRPLFNLPKEIPNTLQNYHLRKQINKGDAINPANDLLQNHLREIIRAHPISI